MKLLTPASPPVTGSFDLTYDGESMTGKHTINHGVILDHLVPLSLQFTRGDFLALLYHAVQPL